MDLNEDELNRLTRVALVCHAEQLLTRNQLMRVLEVIHSDLETQQRHAQLASLLPGLTLDKLQQRLAGHWQDLAQCCDLLGHAMGESQVPIFPHLRDQADPLATASPVGAPVLIEQNDEPVTPYASDLQVNHLNKILLPLAILALGGLVVAVVITARSISQYWWTSDRRPSVGERGPMEETEATLVSRAAVEEEDAALTEAELVALAIDSVESYARDAEWDEALEVLDRLRANHSQTAPFGPLQAGLLLAKQDFDTALRTLVDPQHLHPQSQQWRQLFAISLIRASLPTVQEAISSLRAAIDDGADEEDFAIVLDWARARNKTPPADLPALQRRLGDIDTSALDELFLVLAQFETDNTDQFKRHLDAAISGLEALPTELQNSDEPGWLSDVIHQELESILDKLQNELDDRVAAGPK